MVAGPSLEIFDIVARYPGSYHDSNIFNRSSVKGRFERRELPGYLLGDAGYPCLSYFLTPFREPHTPRERRYNQIHIQKRNIIERLFGVLKRRFPCLQRGLATNVTTTCYIIVACAVLHNISVARRDDIEEAENADDDNEIAANPVNLNVNFGLGPIFRANIVRNYFE